tara:strand:- start:39 stop:326 length:288 start_codon:yes stop_codon:yes gene_type:complete
MIIEAISKIKSDAQVTVNGDNIDTCEIIWHDNNPTNITKEEIKSKMQEIEYIDKRAKEYPSITDQLDMQYWDNVNGTTTWQDAIAKVKADNPKGS